jgi:hypothetical protein
MTKPTILDRRIIAPPDDLDLARAELIALGKQCSNAMRILDREIERRRKDGEIAAMRAKGFHGAADALAEIFPDLEAK